MTNRGKQLATLVEKSVGIHTGQSIKTEIDSMGFSSTVDFKLGHISRDRQKVDSYGRMDSTCLGYRGRHDLRRCCGLSGMAQHDLRRCCGLNSRVWF